MVLTDTNTTLLTLDPITVPPYSARGIVQTLDPIPQAFMGVRTVDGELLNLSLPAMQKYRSIITCRDLDGPALAGVWQGQILTVGCVKELKYVTATGSAGRPAVADSTYVEGIYTYFRPELIMMVTNYTDSFEEYEAMTNWQIELEEV